MEQVIDKVWSGQGERGGCCLGRSKSAGDCCRSLTTPMRPWTSCGIHREATNGEWSNRPSDRDIARGSQVAVVSLRIAQLWQDPAGLVARKRQVNW